MILSIMDAKSMNWLLVMKRFIGTKILAKFWIDGMDHVGNSYDIICLRSKKSICVKIYFLKYISKIKKLLSCC